MRPRRARRDRDLPRERTESCGTLRLLTTATTATLRRVEKGPHMDRRWHTKGNTCDKHTLSVGHGSALRCRMPGAQGGGVAWDSVGQGRAGGGAVLPKIQRVWLLQLCHANTTPRG
eukprot:TRINITY_DN870_c0_g1_i1.p4 TRINITY_DN870_c0_g1~~TRINITY_DN870_c0_g1_i1.p4  ORF type:complete len:116 (-),score=6.33 TRINITY_DN870_c0_g1_i1:635-982(-)